MCAEADKGSALLFESGDDKLTNLAVREIFACNGVNYFKVKVIVPYMNAVVLTAAYADTGAVNLSKTVNIVKLDAKLLGYSVSHLLAPAL